MAEPQPSAKLVYASAVAADAFARSLLQAHDVPSGDAAIIAGCLVSADLRGVDTHGLCRLPIYLERVRAGLRQAALDSFFYSSERLQSRCACCGAPRQRHRD